jgi:hypothetical protein
MELIDVEVDLGESVASESLTNKELAEIASRCERATPGPWSHSGDGIIETGTGPNRVIVIACKGAQGFESSLPSAANGEFIAQAREDLPRLVTEVLRLREALERIASEQVPSPEEFARGILEQPNS